MEAGPGLPDGRFGRKYGRDVSSCDENDSVSDDDSALESDWRTEHSSDSGCDSEDSDEEVVLDRNDDKRDMYHTVDKANARTTRDVVWEYAEGNRPGYAQTWTELPTHHLQTNQDMLLACAYGDYEIHDPTTLDSWDPVPGLTYERFGHDCGAEPIVDENDLLIEDGSESEYDSDDDMIHERRFNELQYIQAELEELHPDREEWIEKCLEWEATFDEDWQDLHATALRQGRDEAVEEMSQPAKEHADLKRKLNISDFEVERLGKLLIVKNSQQDRNYPHRHCYPAPENPRHGNGRLRLTYPPRRNGGPPRGTSDVNFLDGTIRRMERSLTMIHTATRPTERLRGRNTASLSP